MVGLLGLVGRVFGVDFWVAFFVISSRESLVECNLRFGLFRGFCFCLDLCVAPSSSLSLVKDRSRSEFLERKFKRNVSKKVTEF